MNAGSSRSTAYNVRPRFDGIPFHRDLLFLAMSGIASIGFFAATMIAFFLLPQRQFAQISVYLSLGIVIGAIFQFGANVHLPSSAKQSSSQLEIAFGRNIVLAITLAVTLVAVSILLTQLAPTASRLDLRWLAALGGVYSIQLVCDGYLRAKAKPLVLASINLATSICLFSAIGTAGFAHQLTPEFFLISILITKLVFVVVAVCFNSEQARHWIPRGPRSVWLPPNAFWASLLIYSLGLIDTMILAPSTEFGGVSSYLSRRHFAYGVYLAVVQELAMPLLVANLVKRDFTRASYVMIISVIAGVAVVATAAVVNLFLSAFQAPAYSYDDLSQIFISAGGVGLHAATVIALKVSVVSGALTPTHYTRMFGVLAVTLLILLTIGISTVAAATAIWMCANTICFLAAIFTLKRQISNESIARLRRHHDIITQ